MATTTQQIQQCVQQCQQVASQLRSMANAETNPKAKTMLNEGAHHLDLCVTECQYSVQQIQVAGQ
ncbi:MAG: hypothetical protein M1609_08195 [Firmicutes bacterium]|nr:hypothetical protein [Bacillota bacterium]